jgi:sialate O-acetylesterase
MQAMIRFPGLVLALFFACWPAPAQIKLPAVISDGMVLQRGAFARIWGWGRPGETIEIAPSWKPAIPGVAVGGARPSWFATIQTPPEGGGPYTLTITGSESGAVVVRDVLVGEVWLASGQSNMEMPVGDQGGGYRGVRNWQDEVEKADHPRIRLFNVTNVASRMPLPDCRGSWKMCGSESVRTFSGTAYFFGRALEEALRVPIGLITADWGGTPAEAWTSEDGLRGVGYAAASRPASQGAAPSQHAPSALYNGMIAPLTPFTIRGVIWYQGESNRARAAQYRTLFPAMIADWRKKFDLGDFPFYYVQIAPFEYKDAPANSTALREAQRAALSVPNTGMVVTTDIGNPTDIHPDDKQEVGRRLSLWALAKTYGRKDLVCSGPLYRSMKVEGAAIRIAFDHVGGGLSSGGKPLACFEIAGEDRAFVAATAVIDGASVVVSSPAVLAPVAVRFASGHAPEPNLMNAEGLPASPFRTDDWPLER